MEHITIGQISNAITLLMVIAGAFMTIYKFVKDALFDKMRLLDNRITKLEELNVRQKQDIQDSKDERKILLEGTLACLKGLHELNCNGPVTEGIENIEKYLMTRSHK